MGFRTIVIKNRCKLEYSLGYMVCRKLEEEIKVSISEIEILMIENTGVALTAALVSSLLENKVKIIFCDSKANPIGEIVPYQNNYSSYKKIKEQIAFSQNKKDILWKEIIKKKIFFQHRNLLYLGLAEEQLLREYYDQVIIGDKTNREGHAAKVYFNALFGKEFSRKKELEINKYLNYGYSILLSAINREIKICGFLTELGIHHIGETNPFNLSCDFMEPIRPLVDSYVIKNQVNQENFKEVFIDMLNTTVLYNNNKMFLSNALRLYVQCFFKYLGEEEHEEVLFIDYEL